MTGSGSGVGGLTPSIEGSEPDQFVSVDEDERAFGRYHLRFEIASGGMATVYLARSKGAAGFDRAVAVKRIHPHLAKKKEFVEMFLDEARLGARITHPNVCSVFDFGEVDGTYFMAMEYLVGQPMSSLLRALNGRPEVASSKRWHALAAKIIGDACEGLHAAHELTDERGQKLGVVHRDCSPHNIFVTYDGGVKVVDFGVARSEGRLHHTQTGALKGKLGYMSPEQVGGKDVDRRLDVWALGVCLWELLAVKRLFGKRQEVELIQAVAGEPIRPPSSVRAGIPRELDRIVLKALERDLDKRYPTARAMARDLNAFVSSSGVSAGLADLSELMEELFERERATKLGVVASVLATGSDALFAGSKSGQRVIEAGAALVPTNVIPGPAALPATQIHESARTTPGAFAFPEPNVGKTTPSAPAFHVASPPSESSASAVPLWIWPAALAGVLLIVLLGIGVAATTGAPAPEARALPMTTATYPPGTSVDPATALVVRPTPPLPIEPAASPSPIVDVVAPPVVPATTALAPAPAAEPSETVHRAPAHARTGPGTIAIGVTGGWADIDVDGEARGRTPRSIEVPAGRHDVELRMSGHAPGLHRSVTVRAGATSRLVVPFGG